jgi:hypothetical protein
MPFCHSEKMSLNPLFTPSREEMNRKIPKARTMRRRTFLLERMGISSQTESAPLLDIYYVHPGVWVLEPLMSPSWVNAVFAREFIRVFARGNGSQVYRNERRFIE